MSSRSSHARRLLVLLVAGVLSLALSAAATSAPAPAGGVSGAAADRQASAERTAPTTAQQKKAAKKAAKKAKQKAKRKAAKKAARKARRQAEARAREARNRALRAALDAEREGLDSYLRGVTDVRLISVNDLHGNLEPPSGSSGRVTLADGTTVNAGGAAYLATHVLAARAEVQNSIVVGAGDLIGASPLSSAIFHDEPTIALLDLLGMSASSAGNHEFDEGYAELQRIQRGGCHPVDGCQFEPTYDGSDFPFLGANVTFDDGSPALLPHVVQELGGVRVGIIGAPFEGVPDVVTAAGIAGLRFGDEVEAIDRTSAALDRMGVKAQVVLVHQGSDVQGGGPNDCRVVPGPGTEIAASVTPRVDAILMGHSHQAYNCVVPDPAGQPRRVTQGSSFGRLTTVLDLRISRLTKDVIRSDTRAENRIVTRDVVPDPRAQAIVDAARTRSAPVANRPIGSITADVVRAANAAGESPLGDLIADSQLEATRASNGAQVALMNPGGIRADLTFAPSPAGEGAGVVTYGEAFTVQPFGNVLQTVTLTGAQLDAVLEQQWRAGSSLVLQVSQGLTYAWSASAPIGSKVTALAIDGVPVDPAASYRVTVNNFLAGGGDGFSALTAGTDLAGGPVDLDAFAGYLATRSPIAPPAPGRITALP